MQFFGHFAIRRVGSVIAAAVLVVGTGSTAALADQPQEPTTQTADTAIDTTQADTQAEASTDSEAKATAEAEARAKAEAEAKAKADADARATANAVTKAKADAMAKQEEKERTETGTDNGIAPPGTAADDDPGTKPESPPPQDGTDIDDPTDSLDEGTTTLREVTAPPPEFIEAPSATETPSAADAPSATEAPSADDVALIRLTAADCVAWDIDGTAAEEGDHKAAADAEVTVTAIAGEGCAITGDTTWTHTFGTAADADVDTMAESARMDTPEGLEVVTDTDVLEAGAFSAAILQAPVAYIPNQLDLVRHANRPKTYTQLITADPYVDIYVTGPTVCGGDATVHIFQTSGSPFTVGPLVGTNPGSGFGPSFEVNSTQSARVVIPGNSTFIPGVWAWDGAKHLADPSKPVNVVISGCPTVTLATAVTQPSCTESTGSVTLTSKVTNNTNKTRVNYTYSVNGAPSLGLGSSTTSFGNTIGGLPPNSQIVAYAQIEGGQTSQVSASIGGSVDPASCLPPPLPLTGGDPPFRTDVALRDTGGPLLAAALDPPPATLPNTGASVWQPAALGLALIGGGLLLLAGRRLRSAIARWTVSSLGNPLLSAS